MTAIQVAAGAGALIAPAARRWLAAATGARVAHVFEAAAYLADPKAGVLLLALPPLGPGPFSLVLERPGFDFLDTMEVDEPVAVSPGKVSGRRWKVDASTARPWRARPPWSALRRQHGRVREGLVILRESLAARGPRGTFGPIVLGSTEADAREGVHLRLRRRGQKAIDRLAAALTTSDRSSLESAAQALAGLGVGFTPAGDDVLMGAMLACWATRPIGEAGPIGRMLANAAAPRTTTASTAWLKAAARGEATGPWHHLVDAMASADPAGLARACHSVLETGHTSGEDALAGFLLAMEAQTRS